MTNKIVMAKATRQVKPVVSSVKRSRRLMTCLVLAKDVDKRTRLSQISFFDDAHCLQRAHWKERASVMARSVAVLTGTPEKMTEMAA